jgi:integrase
LLPLAPRNYRAIATAIGQRPDRPLLLDRSDRRLDRHAAARIVRRLARHAGVPRAVSPHSLRHAAITAALDAGFSLRDVQVTSRVTPILARPAATTAPAAHSTATPPTSWRPTSRAPPAPADRPPDLAWPSHV